MGLLTPLSHIVNAPVSSVKVSLLTLKSSIITVIHLKISFNSYELMKYRVATNLTGKFSVL